MQKELKRLRKEICQRFHNPSEGKTREFLSQLFFGGISVTTISRYINEGKEKA